jgi:hypothetical protein
MAATTDFGDSLNLADPPPVPAADTPPPGPRRKEKNLAIEIAKIAAGGLAGCVLSVLLLRYVFLMDITGLLPVPKSEPQQVVEANPRESGQSPRQPTEPTAPEPTRDKGQTPIAPPESPAEVSSTGSGTTTAEAVTDPPPTGNKKKGKKGKAAPPPMPAAPTVVEAPVLREKRLAAPPQAEQDEAARKIEAAYGLARLTTTDEKFRMTDELLKATRMDGVSPAEQFVLLVKAAELAEQAGDAQRMSQMIELLTRTFDVEPLPLEAEMLERFAAAARSEAAIQSLVSAARPVVQFAIREERFDLAQSLADATLKACNQPAGLAHRKFVAEGQKIVAREEKQREACQQALKKLAATPDDAAANHTVGTWLVQSRGDWEAALPYLSRCGKPALKLAADLELAQPASAEETLAAAEAWHDAARASGASDVWLVRALYWYRRTDKGRLDKPAAANLDKAVEQLRTDERAQQAAQDLAAAPGRGQIDKRLPQAARHYCVLLLTMEEASALEWGQERMLADASGQFNHGLVEGPVFVPGKAGSALSFDGRDDVVQCADQPSLNPQAALTICAWIRPESWQKPNMAHDYVLSKDDWSRGPHGFVLRLGTGGQLDLTLGQGSGWSTAKTESKVKLGQWTHIAAVYDGQRQVLLVNGVEQSSLPFARPIAASTYPLRIGLGAYAKDRRFHGLIDEVALFATALPAADLRAIYDLGTAGQPLAR